MTKPSHEYCEECNDWNGNISNCMEICSIPMNIIEQWEKYRAIGTVDECRAAVEKQKTIKPHKNFEKFSGVWCSCGKYLGKGYFVDKPNYCPDCGQKLDWRDEEYGGLCNRF